MALYKPFSQTPLQSLTKPPPFAKLGFPNELDLTRENDSTIWKSPMYYQMCHLQFVDDHVHAPNLSWLSGWQFIHHIINTNRKKIICKVESRWRIVWSYKIVIIHNSTTHNTHTSISFFFFFSPIISPLIWSKNIKEIWWLVQKQPPPSLNSIKWQQKKKEMKSLKKKTSLPSFSYFNYYYYYYFY